MKIDDELKILVRELLAKGKPKDPPKPNGIRYDYPALNIEPEDDI
jgi:hypothetical protein